MCLSYTGLKSLPRLQAFHPPAERIREARDKFADRGDIAQNGFDHLPNLPGEVGECQQAGDHKKCWKTNLMSRCHKGGGARCRSMRSSRRSMRSKVAVASSADGFSGTADQIQRQHSKKADQSENRLLKSDSLITHLLENRFSSSASPKHWMRRWAAGALTSGGRGEASGYAE